MTFLNLKTFNAFLVIILLLISSLFSVNVSATELCADAGFPIYPSVTALSIPSTTTISSSNLCVNAFSLDLTSYSGKFVLIEIQLNPFPNDTTSSLYYNPYLIGLLGSVPTINSLSTPTFGQSDRSGLMNRKDYHHIELTNTDTNSGGTYNFAFYRNFSSSSNYYSGSISYTVTITAANNYMCPRNCNNQGTCKNSGCSCNTGYFDLDCSIQANLIQIPGDDSATIQPMNWTYFYVPVDNYDNTFTIAFFGYSFPLTMYYNEISPDDYTLPSVDPSSAIKIITLNDSPYDFPYNGGSDDSDDDGNLFVIGFRNTDPSLTSTTIYYQVQVNSDSSSTNVVMTIIISILAFFILVTLIIIIFKLRQLKRLRLQAEMAQIAQAQAQVTPQFLTPEQIDQYFPKTPYRKMRNHFQTSCSICLDDFQVESSCRRLYCGHVYHDACIEEWLKKHDKCPNCNKEMTAAAINEFVKNPYMFSPNSKIQSMTFDFRHGPQTINRLGTQVISPLMSPGSLQQKGQTEQQHEQAIQVDTIEDTNSTFIRKANRQTSIDMQMNPGLFRNPNRQTTVDLNPIEVRVQSPNETAHH